MLIGLVVLQGFAAAFFLSDVLLDIFTIGLETHIAHEIVATLALILGSLFGGVELWRALQRNRRSDAALQMASGAFSDLLRGRFRDWKLSPSERQVALMTLKGFDGPEIAALRGTAAGTVRAQLGNIYAKSGTNGRGQFVSLFIDDLLEEPIILPDGETLAEKTAMGKKLR